jgi:hypothetical protein
MPTSVPALVNPPLLVWAREQSGYEPEPVAKGEEGAPTSVGTRRR